LLKRGNTDSPPHPPLSVFQSYADALKNSFRKEDNEAKMTPLKTVTHKQKSTLSTRV
jgi:hypothetical protein